VLALVYTTTVDGAEVVRWRHIFWIFGSLGVVWCVAFWWWFRDRPQDHPAVNSGELAVIRGAGQPAAPLPGVAQPRSAPTGSSEERILAEPALTALTSEPVPTGAATQGAPAPASHEEHGHRNVPWLGLLTNLNLWVLCLMYFCAAYGWYFNITWLPKYLASEGGVTEKTHGIWVTSLLAGAPLLVGSLACLMGGLATDFFIKQTGDRKWGRRLFGAVGHGACALCYFLALVFRSPWLFVLFLALAAFCNDLTMGSAWASCIDIGGKYAGIVSGCMNTVGNLGGALAGISAGFVVEHLGSRTGWKVNLLSYALAYVVAVVLWLFFDATRQVPQSADR
jgi:nitrate/nitrite transporter NarK